MSRLRSYWPFILLSATLIFIAAIRIRLLPFPLERDEGEYAYAAQLMLRSISPYSLCYTMKLPGTAGAYALIMAAFGQTPSGIHLGLLLVNAGVSVLLYFLASRLFRRLAGVIAAASFATLSLSCGVLGFVAHATQFVLLPAVSGILLLEKAIAARQLHLFFLSGLLLGLAFLMKQPGVLFLLFALFYLFVRPQQAPHARLPQAGMLLLGATLPFALTCLAIAASGGFDTFWFWTMDYAREYAVAAKPRDIINLLPGTLSTLVLPTLGLWILAAAGLPMLYFYKPARLHARFVLGFLLFSLAAVSAGFHFRNHYFVLLLPAVALLVAIAVNGALYLLKGRWAVLPLAVFALAFAASFISQRALFFKTDPADISRELYLTNPFAEAPQIADYVRQHSGPEDRIAVLGSEPEMYFYAQRLSATGYIYMYPLLERQPFASHMQQEMMREITDTKPLFLILVTAQLSWLPQKGADGSIIGWAQAYARDHYHMVGLVDSFKDHEEFHWDAEAKESASHSPLKVYIFRRND